MPSDMKNKKLMQRFLELSVQAKKKGLSSSQIRRVLISPLPLPCGKEAKGRQNQHRRFEHKTLFISALLLGTFLALLVYKYYASAEEYVTKIQKEKCAVDHNDYTREMLRPVMKCDFCRNLINVTVEENITASQFLNKYAYSKVPALIKGETKNWTAVDKFDFYLLKDIFLKTEGALRAVLYQCQFHPYKTEFKSIEETFNMTDERASGKDTNNPWYIGWSNCHAGLRTALRKYYQRPSFLPSEIETSIVDWVFMGTPGQGAATHVDYIHKPSWQAQVSGRKTWTLIPPPECESECKVLHVTADKGDILAVDTNVWFHSTYVEPGEISIAVGSEYD